MLERSKKARLSIKLDIDWGARDVYIPVFDHLPHIGKLSIHKSSCRGLEDTLEYLEGIPAPMLESLCICCTHIRSDTPAFRLPDNVLLVTPRLRQLCLSNIPTDLTSTIFSSSLTTLKPKGLQVGNDPTFPQLWALLERLPELEVLGLAWVVFPDLPLQSDDIQATRRRHPIPLSKVTKVELEGPQPHLQFLVDNITLSQDIESLHIIIVHEHTSTLGRLICDASHAFSEAFSPHTVSVRRKNRYSPLCFAIRAVPSQRSSESSTLETSVRRFNLFGPPSDPFSDTEIDVGFTELFESFHWTNLAVLELNGLVMGTLPSADTLAHTFGSLPSIYYITVGRQASSLLVEILQRGVELVSDDSASRSDTHTTLLSQHRIIFPGLSVLKMCNVEFDMGRTDDEAEEVDELSVNYQSFTECLRNRRNKGMPIRAMQLVDCESGPLDSRALGEVVLPSLKELVENVHWVVPVLCVEFTDSEEDSDDCL